MQFWNEIVNTALLGTDKRPLNREWLPDLLPAADMPGDREDEFLQVASLLLNYRRCGTVPLQKDDLIMPSARPEELPYCAVAATHVLRDIIAEEEWSLMSFWLQRCAGAKKIVLPDMIPPIMNRAVHQKALQLNAVAVCGKRGEWLGQFNPEWRFGMVAADNDVWETGTMEQRKGLLLQLRVSDVVGARALLMQAWHQENANNKAELLKQLQGTLTIEDNEWLSSLLEEKSQKVKEQALALLKELPGSSIVEKYWEIVKNAVVLKKEKALLGMVNKTSLQVVLPASWDEWIFKTGIEKLSSDKKIPDDAYILMQLIGYIPPVYWENYFGTTPEDVIGYFQKDQLLYLPSLISAAVQFRDTKWALALIWDKEIFRPELLPLLSVKDREVYAAKYFIHYPEAILQYARQEMDSWSHDLARVIFTHTARNAYTFHIGFYREQIHHIPVSIAMELEKLSPREPHLQVMWSNLSEQILKLLIIKENIIKAFHE